MTPGPTHVVRCPLCKQLGSYETINSGNTFGATYYTDGKRVAPMLPVVPPVVVCAHCSGLFWLSQAEELGNYERYGRKPTDLDPAWKAAEPLDEPDEAQYLTWLERLRNANPERARDLRLHVWWRGNDRLRGKQAAHDDDSLERQPAREANMRALLPLLAGGGNVDTLMQAEVLRQLGEFDRALDLLSQPLPDQLQTAVKRLRSLCETGDTQLRELL
jgi:hypothetical protein